MSSLSYLDILDLEFTNSLDLDWLMELCEERCKINSHLLKFRYILKDSNILSVEQMDIPLQGMHQRAVGELWSFLSDNFSKKPYVKDWNGFYRIDETWYKVGEYSYKYYILGCTEVVPIYNFATMVFAYFGTERVSASYDARRPCIYFSIDMPMNVLCFDTL